jgi:hypothetical protein
LILLVKQDSGAHASGTPFAVGRSLPNGVSMRKRMPFSGARGNGAAIAV